MVTPVGKRVVVSARGDRGDRVRRPRQRPRRRARHRQGRGPGRHRRRHHRDRSRCCATAGWRSTCTCRRRCGGPARTSSASPGVPSWAPGRRRRRPRSRSRCGHESHGTTEGPDATRGDWLMSGLHAAGKQRKKKKKKKKVLRLTVPMVDRLFWRAGFGPTEADRAKWKNKPVMSLVDWFLNTKPALKGPAPTRDGQRLDPTAEDVDLVLEWVDRMIRTTNPFPERHGLLLAPPLRERPGRRPVAADAAQAGRPVPASTRTSARTRTRTSAISSTTSPSTRRCCAT